MLDAVNNGTKKNQNLNRGGGEGDLLSLNSVGNEVQTLSMVQSLR
jgi:hypothetical protein